MNLHKAQNWVTISFIGLMIINVIGGISLFGAADVFSIYLSIYGVHLSIILAYYFVQEPTVQKVVPKFRFILLLSLLVIWNGIILGITIFSVESIEDLDENLGQFPDYADFLVAGGIVWMFNGRNTE